MSLHTTSDSTLIQNPTMHMKFSREALTTALAFKNVLVLVFPSTYHSF